MTSFTFVMFESYSTAVNRFRGELLNHYVVGEEIKMKISLLFRTGFNDVSKTQSLLHMKYKPG